MKYLFVSILILGSLQQQVHAQTNVAESQAAKSQTMAAFTAPYATTFHRYYVYLPNGNKMIVQLYKESDIYMVKNLDSILTTFLADINFYKDSLQKDPTENVTIDYAINGALKLKEFRFKKYLPDGDLFIRKQNDLSPLKIEQDTVRILIRNKPYKQAEDINYGQAELTFVLNNYTDLERLIEDRHSLNEIFDTLGKAAYPHNLKYEYIYRQLDPNTIFYHPYDSFATLYKYNGATIKEEKEYLFKNGSKYSNILLGTFNIGVGLVRDGIAPMAKFGFEFDGERLKKYAHHKNWLVAKGSSRIVSIMVTPYYLFTKGHDGKYQANDNWFVTGEVGKESFQDFEEDKFDRLFTNSITLGAGYLFHSAGDFYTKTTVKIFVNYRFIRAISISPEMILTNNLHTIFPGLTVCIFNGIIK